jgi:peptidoglycan/xylan/chitin deacetylase (PgdA/CDA1 family)
MKNVFFSILHRLRITRLVAWWHRKRTVMLCYHSISKFPRASHDEFKLHLPLDLFISHLDYLQKHHNVIPLAEYLKARREGRRLPDYTAVLTFDDGTRNFFTAVAPLLIKRKLSATAFVITSTASERENSSFGSEWTPIDDLINLSWSEIRALAREPGIEIGSHSHTHPNLSIISAEDMLDELTDSLAAIAKHTGNSTPSLAYPHGQASESVRKVAALLGYACAFTGQLGANDMESDLYALQRVVIAGDDDIATFAARVSGLTWWYDRGRAVFGRGSARGRDGYEAPFVGPRSQDESFVQMKKPSPEPIP